MRRLRLRIFLPLLFCSIALLAKPSDSSAGWKLIKQMPTIIDCGFFYDEMNGFVGAGLRRTFNTSAQIFHTTDGGTTWTQATVPLTQGAVTSIFMLDKVTGYASIFSNTQTLWKTVDGGGTWKNIPMANGQGDCVYATSSSIFLTEWIMTGGVSTNGGANFSQTFADRQLGVSCGIDFADDMHGVISMGPHSPNQGASTYSTSDGGVNWTKGYDLLESWSVYALKGTQTFLSAAESTGGLVQNVIYKSIDNGVTWQSIYTFPDPALRLTGHIAGKGSRVYAQTDVIYNGGMLRSDDLGQSWTPINGPSNSRDTRFVVTGCVGQVVYAFDDNGGIWKTTDGGDGTVGTGGANLSVSTDTLRLPASYCQPISNAFMVANLSCATTIIDSTIISSDPSLAFRLRHPARDTLVVGTSDSVQVSFDPQQSSGDTSVITIFAHQGGQRIVKQVILAGHNFTSPTPFLAPIKSLSAADTVSVAVYLVPTKDKFSIASFAFHLTFNGDVLTPVGITTKGTLTDGATTATWRQNGNNGAICTVKPVKPIDQTFDPTKPLVFVKMRATLGDSLASGVKLDSFAINGPAPLALCSTPDVRFTMIPKCGDSTISISMSNQPLLRWLTVAPNPTSGGKVTLHFYLESASVLDLEIADQSTPHPIGIVTSSFSAGEHSYELDTHSLRSGSYFVVVRAPSGAKLTKKLIELR